mgnify:CR=1 FL=1
MTEFLPPQAIDGNRQVIPNVFEPGTTKKVTSAGTSVQSTVYAADTIVDIVGDADCYYEFGTDPTALSASTSGYLPSKNGMQKLVRAGHKIAIIGTVNVYITAQT